MDGPKVIDHNHFQRSIAPKNFKEDFKALSSYLSYFSASYIRTPFQSNSLQLTRDKQNFIVTQANGRIATCNRLTKEILQEKDLRIDINSLSLSVDGKDGYITTPTGELVTLRLDELEITNKIQISSDPLTLISILDDNTLLISADKSLLLYNTDSKSTTKIFSHSDPVSALDSNTNYIVSGSSSGGLVVITKDLNEKITRKYNEFISSIKIDAKYLVVSSDSFIHTIDAISWEDKHSFKGHANTITCIEITGNYLVSGSNDSSLKLWRLDQWSDEVSLHGHTDSVIGIVVHDNIVHSLGKDFKIRASRLPALPSSVNYSSGLISELIHNPKSQITYAISSDHKLYELGSRREIKTFDSPNIGWSFINFDTVLVVFVLKNYESSNTVAHFVDLQEPAKSRSLDLRTSSIPTVCIASENGKYLITGEMFRITVWNTTDGNLEYIFRSHTSNITAIANYGQGIFTGDEGGFIKQYSLEEFEEIANFNEIDSTPIKIIKVSSPSKLLFSATGDFKIKVWSIERKSSIYVINILEPIKSLSISNGLGHLFINYSNKIDLWNINSLSSSFSITFPEENSLFALLKDDEIILSYPSYYKVLENPLRTSTISFYGDSARTHEYVDYISKIFSGYTPKYDEKMGDWVIEPFHINILHIYSYYNLTTHLGKSIKAGTAFYSSKTGYTPLSIGLDKKLGDCVQSLIDNYMPRLKENPINMYYFSNSMAQLNTLSPESLSYLYEVGFSKSLDSSLPKFCTKSVRLPIIKDDSKLFLSADKFLKPSQLKGEHKPIQFTQSYFKINTVLGSQESIDFIESLTHCKNLEVFNTLFVKVLIERKWNKVKWIHYFDLAIYLAYLIAIFCSNGENVKWYLVMAFVINQILLIYEIFQMVSTRIAYFTSFLNYLDIFRTTLFNLYCAVEYFDYHESKQYPILFLTIVLSLIRGFSYFRIFSWTRWLIYLIIEVVYQLWAFIAVTIYTVLSLFLVYKTIKNSLDLFYDKDFKLEWLSLFFVVIINPIISLNLFISIVGNALDKIKNEKTVKDQQELAEMILEAEVIFFWRRWNKKQEFVHLCHEEQSNNIVQASVSEKLRSSAEKTEDLIQIFSLNTREISDLKQTFEDTLSKMNSRADEILQMVKTE